MAEQCASEMKDFEAVYCDKPAENEVSDHDVEKLECAVCLQGCVHPVELPCGHIFCFLCVKGVANQSKRCAMCRKELPSGYLEHPQLVNTVDLEQANAYEDGQQWFYEGHNGWWQYDERTSTELEIAYKRGDHTCELLIAGFLYVIDFEHMVQLRRNDPSRRRRIKRDLATISKKGIAGLRLHDSPTAEVGPEDGVDRDNDGAEGDEEAAAPSAAGASLQVLSNLRFPRSGLPHLPTSRTKSPSPIPTAPNNTPQTPHTPSQDSGTSSPTTSSNPSLQQIVQGMQNVRLNGGLEEDEIL